MSTKTEKITTQLDPVGLYRFSAFKELVAFSRPHWWKLTKTGDAPMPVVQTRTVCLWRGADLLAWLEDPQTYKQRSEAGNIGYPSLIAFVAPAARLAA